MSEIWKRPSDLKFPVQYYKFVTRDSDKDNGKLVEYRVEDIPESRYEEACRFMVKHFVPYEPKLVARKGQDDPLVLEDYYNKYMHGIKQKVSVACLKRGSDEFVGVNILEVLGRNDSSYGFEMKSRACKDVIEGVDHILDKADIFNSYDVDYYLSGTGLAIDVAYRGLGIATEMIKSRIRMLHFLGLKVTSTGFSSVGAQKAALKAGCVVDFGMSYADLAKVNPNWNFCGTETESYIQMSMSVK